MYNAFMIERHDTGPTWADKTADHDDASLIQQLPDGHLVYCGPPLKRVKDPALLAARRNHIYWVFTQALENEAFQEMAEYYRGWEES